MSIVTSYTGGNKRITLTLKKSFAVIQHDAQYDEEGQYMRGHDAVDTRGQRRLSTERELMDIDS